MSVKDEYIRHLLLTVSMSHELWRQDSGSGQSHSVGFREDLPSLHNGDSQIYKLVASVLRICINLLQNRPYSAYKWIEIGVTEFERTEMHHAISSTEKHTIWNSIAPILNRFKGMVEAGVRGLRMQRPFPPPRSDGDMCIIVYHNLLNQGVTKE
jgi:hypothetical protein